MIVSLKKYITYVTKKSNTNIYKTKKKIIIIIIYDKLTVD